PSFDGLHRIGTRAVVKRAARGDGAVELIVQGVERVELVNSWQTEPYLTASYRVLPLPNDDGTELEALHRTILELAGKLLELTRPQVPVSVQQIAVQAPDPLALAYLVGSMLNLDV